MSLLPGHRKPKIRALQGSQLQHYLGTFRDSDSSRLRKEQSPSSHSQGGNSPLPNRRSMSLASSQSFHRKRKAYFSASDVQVPSSHIVSATIKVYANVLHPDVLYKAAHVTQSTSAVDVVKELIDRFAASDEDKDPGIFCLVEAGDNSSHIRMLQDSERPLAVQAEWPNDSYCFRLCRRPDYQGAVDDKPVSYSGERTVSVATPFPGSYSSMKLDFDDATTAKLMVEQTLLEYDASLDPILFGLYEVWIEEPSRRKKGRQLRDSELIINVIRRVASSKVTLQLRKKPSEDEKKSRTRRSSSESVTSVATRNGSVLSGGVNDDISRSCSPSPDLLGVFNDEWEQRYDEKSQKNYYVSKLTRESSWINPASLRQPNMDADLPFGWERGYDKKSKRIYFINHLTRETTWKNPNRLSVDVHNLRSSQWRDTSNVSPDSGAFVGTPSPFDAADFADKSSTKDSSPVDPERDDVFDNQLGSYEEIHTSTPAAQGSAFPPPVLDEGLERSSDSKVADNFYVGDNATTGEGRADQLQLWPQYSTSVDTVKDAANSSMFLWTPQPERRSISPGEDATFDRMSLFNRSERTRRSARLRGFMLQSLNQGMAGMMQEIASEGRGGLWTPQENRRRTPAQEPDHAERKEMALTERRGSESRDNELILECQAQSAPMVNVTRRMDKEKAATEEETRKLDSDLRPNSLTVFRFEGMDTSTGQPTLSPDKTRKPFRRSSGGSRSPGHAQKAIDLQAVQAREELKRLSRGGSTSNSPENNAFSAATGTTSRSSRENTPTARVSPYNHVQRRYADGICAQSTDDKQSPHATIASSVKSTQPICSGRSDDSVAGTQSAPQIVTVTHVKTPRLQLVPDLSPASSTTYPSKVPSSDARLSPTLSSKTADQSADAMATETVNEADHDSDTGPLATVTVDPSGSIVARASSSGKLTAVATTETTEVTTTTEVMEIASTPPKRTKTTTTEKKTLTTAKVVPDDVAGLKNEQPQTVSRSFQEMLDVKEEEKQQTGNGGQHNRQETSAATTYCVEETQHSVQTSVGDKHDDNFLRSEKTEQESEAVNGQLSHQRQSQVEQNTSNKTEMKEIEDESSVILPKLAAGPVFATRAKETLDARSADPKKLSGSEQQSLQESDRFAKPLLAGVIESDTASKEEKNTARNSAGDCTLDDENPFVSYLNRRRFSAAANLEWHQTTAGNEDTVTKRATASGWRNRLGKLYAANDDDEWVRKRRQGRSPSMSAVLEYKEKKQTENSEYSKKKEGDLEDKSKLLAAESNDKQGLSPSEDRIARRRRFFESKSLEQQRDSSSSAIRQMGSTSARSWSNASAKRNDIASLKQDTSPKLQLKSHVEARIPSSRLLADRKTESVPATGTEDSSSDNRKLTAEEKTSKPSDSLSTQGQKFKESARKTAFSPSLSSNDVHTGLGVLQSRRPEAVFRDKQRLFEEPRNAEHGNDMQTYTGKATQPAQAGCAVNEKRHVSSTVPSQERVTEQFGQLEISGMTPAMQQEQPCSDVGTQSSISASRSSNVYSARRKFFEEQSRQRQEAERTSSASSSLHRSKSFQLRSSWLASERRTSPSVKDTTDATNVSDRHEAVKHRPIPRTSPPHLRSRSPRSGRSSPKSPKERLKVLEAELEQIESDVYRLLPGQPSEEAETGEER